MVNWQDPALLLRDYLDLTKLLHAVGGLYIWETVFSAGFELDVLRGKQPYRWTIWIYLGTRYSCLLMFIVFFIHNDVGHVPCKPFMLMHYGFDVVSWAFPSLIIVLRVVAIWDRCRLVSAISFTLWSTAFGLNIRGLWSIGAKYDPALEVCFITNMHRDLAGTIAIPAADAILFLLMLVGLLRRAHGNKSGIWLVLYNQCIIWMAVAAFAEIPPMVFLILNLNGAWNSMFPGVAAAILSICAARMYRALCQHGSLTEYEPSDPPYPAGGLPFPNCYRRRSAAHDVRSSLHFRAAGTTMLSERITTEPFVFVESEHVQTEYALGSTASRSNTTLTVPVPAKTKAKDVPVQAGYRLSWQRPVNSSMQYYD